MESDVTPESATLVCGSLRVDSSKANRELDYIETPLETLLADMLAWMRQEGSIGK
jgi:dihydroflavonol-4-reductase